MEIKHLFYKRQFIYVPGKYPGAFKNCMKLIAWWLRDFRTIIGGLFKLKPVSHQASLYKKWRHDVSMWEEKIKLFGFITYYKYSIWREGKTYIKIKITRSK